MNPSHARSGLLTPRQGRWWCSSAQPYSTCCKIQELGDPAGLRGKEQDLKDPKTSIRFELLHPLVYWPLPSEKKQVGKQCLVAPTRFCKNQWVGAKSPKALILKNLHLLAKMQLALAVKCGEKELICGVPMIISDTPAQPDCRRKRWGQFFLFF